MNINNEVRVSLPVATGSPVAVRRVLAAAGLVLSLSLAGCTPPVGQDNFRVEPTNTTRAERYDTRVTTTELTEFSDQVVAQLTEDLKAVPELNEVRVTVVFGDLENKTGIVSTTDFEAFRSRIRQKLLQSRLVLQNIRFVESRSKIEALKRREQSRDRDLLQEGARTTTPELNEEYTFFLNGEFYRVARDGVRSETSQYYGLSFNLMRMSNGELVWSSAPYESKRVIPRR